ncbi:PMT-domain-containing protein [Martensiomyces pterosporus]|nr:PMT-domain-containing protein [Martensiomyces pterosporus]
MMALPTRWWRKIPHMRLRNLMLALLTCISLCIRMHNVAGDNRVVWDETHFGRFANSYISGNFYLDVHPPLGKMLIAAAFKWLGYTGSFDFKSGQEYPPDVPYAEMRRMQAVVGALLVPASFQLCNGLRFPPAAAWLAAVFVAFDNALVGISRIFVLDSFLLLANAAALHAFVGSRAVAHRAWSLAWSLRLAYLGTALGLVCSIKLAGLFTTALIGVYVAAGLLRLPIEQPSMSKTRYAAIWIAHFLYLAVLPVAIYFAVFRIHFLQLTNYTPDADLMGSEFVARMSSSALQMQPEFIHNGSYKDSGLETRHFLSCSSAGTVWNIEHQLAADKPNANISRMVSRNFVKDTVALNPLMLQLNSMLVSDPDLLNEIESAPWDWPFLAKPIKMVSWSGSRPKYMLVGNPLLWWGSSAVCMFVHPLANILSMVVRKRSHGMVAGYRPAWGVNFLWCAWAINYLPFFALSRVTYLHHYLPALHSALLLLAVYVHKAIVWCLQACVPEISPARRLQMEHHISAAAACLAIASYYFAHPLTVGSSDPCSYYRYRLLPGWSVCERDYHIH